MSKVDKSAFLTITSGMGWASIDKIVDACDDADFWTDEFLDNAVQEAKKAIARRLMKQLKDDEGMPLFHSVLTKDTETGETAKVYLQEVLFNPADYESVIQYHQDKGNQHFRMARKLNERCFTHYKISFLPGFSTVAAD